MCSVLRFVAMSLDAFEERLHTASFVSHRMVAVKTEKLCGVRCLHINRRFKFTVKVSSNKHIQEGQLLFQFFFPREFYIRKDCGEQAVEILQHILLYDDERVVYVTAQKNTGSCWMKAIFSNSCRTSSATKPETGLSRKSDESFLAEFKQPHEMFNLECILRLIVCLFKSLAQDFAGHLWWDGVNNDVTSKETMI
nr:unnamed protein product [Spirometra erinaceieuropaei]